MLVQSNHTAPTHSELGDVLLRKELSHSGLFNHLGEDIGFRSSG